MGTLIMSATVILVVLGFSHHVLWLAAIALLYLYVRYVRQGRLRTSTSAVWPARTAGSTIGPRSGSSVRPDTSYRAYRRRRDQQARWERRYRRERPREARRQERRR